MKMAESQWTTDCRRFPYRRCWRVGLAGAGRNLHKRATGISDHWEIGSMADGVTAFGHGTRLMFTGLLRSQINIPRFSSSSATWMTVWRFHPADLPSASAPTWCVK